MFDLFENFMDNFSDSDNSDMELDMEDIFGGDFAENDFEENDLEYSNEFENEWDSEDDFEEGEEESDSEFDSEDDFEENEEELDGEADFIITESDDSESEPDGDEDSLEADISLDGLSAETNYDSLDDPYAVPAYIPFDPDSADNVIGNPEEVMDNWHMQETSSSCAVAAQEFALEQLTGQEFDEEELRDLAAENGWYDINGGTSMGDIGNILEYYGLNVERSWDGTIEDIEHCLEQGGQVIVGVDSDEIWFGEDDDFLFFPGNDADHAVQVIGIDRSDADNPMVILNDSGVGNGAGAQVPLDSFLDAWEDSGNFLVEAYK